ncbi:MAG: hypothetical protein NWP80_01985 [Candidatus Gracilibacteria bacterium]|nr:hypothetical protein [Candidatus Gracilibacteria bacterium]
MANYSDLLNVDDFGEKKITFNEDRGNISFYCKDCQEIVETKRVDPKGYTFKCIKCDGSNIAVGTLEGLKENYRIK